jgi:hypothetical protein
MCNPTPQTILEQNIDPITLKLSNTNEYMKVEQKEASTSHKTMAIFKCISGNNDVNFDFLLQKSNKMAEQVEKGQFNEQQAWLGCNSCFIPAMMYSLLAVSIPEVQLDQIKQKATSQFTSAIAVSKELSKTQLYMHQSLLVD